MNIFERKYCIVDNRGNYYRVDDYDALVVASGEESATWFDILEANKRINNSKMKKTLRTVEANKKSMKEKQISEEYDVVESGEFDMDSIDFYRLARELVFVQANVQKYQEKLKAKRSEADSKICDILHFIELYQHDDEQSLELVDQIQEYRKTRREAKDQAYRVETFSRLFSPGGMENILKDIAHQLENMDYREYSSRSLHSLFSQGVKLEDSSVETAENNDVIECTQRDDKEDSMKYEREETFYDNRENNWGRMVADQLGFFASVEQYIINLKIDISELDAKIEELMVQCEDTSCNIAQGYKMFKELRELRLQRKKKSEELNKVSVIADRFDCQSMAKTYRACEEIFMKREMEKQRNSTAQMDVTEESIREVI